MATDHRLNQPQHSQQLTTTCRTHACWQHWWQGCASMLRAHPSARSLIVALVAALMLIILAASVSPSQAQEQPQNQAGVVIRHGDGSVSTSCVTFSEPSISGVELLQRSGMQVITQQGGIGAAVCKIGGEGCDYPTEDCFCKCKSADCQYWAYQRLRGDRWAYSPLGASAAKVLPGDVDGWAWGAGSVQEGAVPPVIPLAQICAVPSTPATPTAPSPTTATLEPRTVAPIAPTQTSIPATATHRMPSATPVVSTAPSIPATVTHTVLATALATATPPPTSLPQPPPPPVVASAVSVADAPTRQPAATSPVPQAPNGSAAPQAPASVAPSFGDYAMFGVIVAILLGGIVVAMRRRSGGR